VEGGKGGEKQSTSGKSGALSGFYYSMATFLLSFSSFIHFQAVPAEEEE
jgi:hypothetical protein